MKKIMGKKCLFFLNKRAKNSLLSKTNVKSVTGAKRQLILSKKREANAPLFTLSNPFDRYTFWKTFLPILGFHLEGPTTLIFIL